MSNRISSFALIAGLAGVAALAGCSSNEHKLVPPEALVAPYDAPYGTDVLWAVAPMNNESGTTTVDVLAVSDALAAKVTEAEGLGAVPMNRTLAAMRALKMDAVRTPADARRLAEALGADGVLVGSITSYDPYTTPKFGLVLGVYGRGGSMLPSTLKLADPGVSRGVYAENPTGVSRFGDRPLSTVNLQFDASNHAVLMDVERYALGRHEDRSALGWQRYTTSMELFTDYAAHASVRRVLDEERLRLVSVGGASTPTNTFTNAPTTPNTPAGPARASVDGARDERH